MRSFLTILLAFFLVSCEGDQSDNVYQGYVESRQLHLAPITSGRLEALYVEEGDWVDAGTILFALDNIRAQAQLAEKRALKAASLARLENLRKGGREEEIKAVQEMLKEAQAALILTQKTYVRTKELVDKKVMAMARLDQDRAARDAAQARVTEIQSRLDLIKLPARDDVIEAATREVDIYTAAIKHAQADLDDRILHSPSEGRIERVYRRIGEMVSPSQPVLSLVSPEMKRVRFFLPEPILPLISYGTRVTLECDNCETGLTGTIIFVADQAEFTPPVIFTETERAKLVYMVEIRPDNPEKFLNGQPVQVILP